MSRDFHLPGRSPVDRLRRHGGDLASARDARRDRDAASAGGNAADAAVAAVAMLCVVEPHMTGIGGDCFCLRREAGRAGLGLQRLRPRRRAVPRPRRCSRRASARSAGNSIHAVTVPGAIDAWAAILKAHGRFGLDRALAPAIRYAESGFPVAPRVAYDWARHVGKLDADPGAARHYLFDGARAGRRRRHPAAGARRDPEGDRRQAAPRAFYEGPIADDMAATVAARGSFLTAEDFAAPSRRGGRRRSRTNYRGLDVVEIAAQRRRG